MTLFFNLENLEKEAQNDPTRFITLLYRLHYKKLPKNRNSIRPAKLPLVGSSFLLNPGPLFREKVDSLFILQYIKLAGRRDYTLYKEFKLTSLPLSYYPDINMSAVRPNPLLTLKDNQIFFKYES